MEQVQAQMKVRKKYMTTVGLKEVEIYKLSDSKAAKTTKRGRNVKNAFFVANLTEPSTRILI